MASDRIRVGAAQMAARPGHLGENLDKHLEFIETARRRKVEILMFPETSLTGYPSASIGDYSLRSDCEEVQTIAQAAGDMTVVFGMVEEAPAAQFYNSVIVVKSKQVVHIHRKLNLATYGLLEEGKHFASGRYIETFALDAHHWRASVLICADSWNPGLVHLAALHGTTLLLLPINSAIDAVSTEFSNPHGWDLASRFYAMIYGMPVVLANQVGTHLDLKFWGGSRIIDPFGTVLVEAGDEEEVIDAELDYAAVRRARIQLPTVRDSNLALLSREVRRLENVIGVPTKVRRV